MSDPVFREGDRLLLPVDGMMARLLDLLPEGLRPQRIVSEAGDVSFQASRSGIYADIDAGEDRVSIYVELSRDSLASLLVRESEVRARALEEALAAVRRCGRPVGAGDGDTYILGSSADAERAIRAIIEKPEGERSCAATALAGTSTETGGGDA